MQKTGSGEEGKRIDAATDSVDVYGKPVLLLACARPLQVIFRRYSERETYLDRRRHECSWGGVSSETEASNVVLKRGVPEKECESYTYSRRRSTREGKEGQRRAMAHVREKMHACKLPLAQEVLAIATTAVA